MTEAAAEDRERWKRWYYFDEPIKREGPKQDSAISCIVVLLATSCVHRLVDKV